MRGVVLDLKGEEWRNIKGAKGLFQVPNQGRIRRLHKLIMNLGGDYEPCEWYVRNTTTKYKGHPTISLKSSPHGVLLFKPVCIFIAEALIDSPEPAPEDKYYYVTHLDGDITNNKVSNLRRELFPRQIIERNYRPREKITNQGGDS